jgi:hypothetical protein
VHHCTGLLLNFFFFGLASVCKLKDLQVMEWVGPGADFVASSNAKLKILDLAVGAS